MPMKPDDRLCLWCEHIEQETERELGEETHDPGYTSCRKGHWIVIDDTPIQNNVTDLYTYLKLAVVCEEFELKDELVQIVEAHV
jgi:hypothetical protein